MVQLRGLLERLVAIGIPLLCAACVTPDRPGGGAAPASAIASPLESVARDLVPTHGRYVLVDTSAFELTAFQDGVPVLRSRVIVGRPGASTPDISSRPYVIEFYPAWSPTPAMIRNERAHYMPPGPQNPLGRILFEIENSQLIYLHDTNDRGLFDGDDRALSHGCVRVDQARQLAAWALDVPMARIDQLISGGATVSIPLSSSIPVSLMRHMSAGEPDRGAFSFRGRQSPLSRQRREGHLEPPGCAGAGRPA